MDKLLKLLWFYLIRSLTHNMCRSYLFLKGYRKFRDIRKLPFYNASHQRLADVVTNWTPTGEWLTDDLSVCTHCALKSNYRRSNKTISSVDFQSWVSLPRKGHWNQVSMKSNDVNCQTLINDWNTAGTTFNINQSKYQTS